MSNDNRSIDPTSSLSSRQAQAARAASQKGEEVLEARQVASERLMVENTDNALFNPFVQMKNAETMSSRMTRHEHKSPAQAKGDDDLDLATIDAVSETASEYENQNPELQGRSLLGLKRHINIHDSPEEILRKILNSYPDHFLADEALDFLLETTDEGSKIGINLRLAKGLLNERFGREIRAGRNINQEAREFARQGLGHAGALRDLYRDVTGNPREAVTLFDELTEAFTFDKMKTVLQFLLHSIGSDLKSKGPSIEPGELHRLFSETRTMQAILGVFRFFFQRMKLIEGLFYRQDLTLPPRLNFELMAKQFVKMLQERYPSPDKILRLASALGISEELLAEIIIFTQYRDAIRGVSPRLFKSEKHRQELLHALLETLSELDDLLEEEEEEEEEKKPPGWKQEDTLE